MDIDTTTWNPASVIVVVGALSTLIGAIVTGAVTIIKALRGQQEVAQDALYRMGEANERATASVPIEAVQAMQRRGSRAGDNQPQPVEVVNEPLAVTHEADERKGKILHQ